MRRRTGGSEQEEGEEKEREVVQNKDDIPDMEEKGGRSREKTYRYMG